MTLTETSLVEPSAPPADASDPSTNRSDGAASTATLDCPVCEHIRVHGWMGNIAPARNHCRDCHRESASLKEGHCRGCCTQFASYKAFDYHLDKDARCLAPSELVRQDGKPRLVVRERRFGPVWAVAFYGERPAHWGAANDGNDSVGHD